jgi:hypothetical protein
MTSAASTVAPANDPLENNPLKVHLRIKSVQAVTKSDTTILDYMTRALYVGNGGDVVVRMANGLKATFSNVPSGAFLPIACDQVLLDTGASNILACY